MPKRPNPVRRRSTRGRHSHKGSDVFIAVTFERGDPEAVGAFGTHNGELVVASAGEQAPATSRHT